MGKKLEVIYICLACFLPLFFSSPACISGFPQLLSKPVARWEAGRLPTGSRGGVRREGHCTCFLLRYGSSFGLVWGHTWVAHLACRPPRGLIAGRWKVRLSPVFRRKSFCSFWPVSGSALFCIQSLIATRDTHWARNPAHQIMEIIWGGTVSSCTLGLAWAFGCQQRALPATGYLDPQGGGSRGKEEL